MAKKFPKEIYVKLDGDHEQDFLNAQEMPGDLVSVGEQVEAAVYVLKEKVKIKGTIVISH